MGGFSSVSGDETIMFADNASFDGTQRGGKMTANGQVWIGSTVSPHVKLGLPNGQAANTTPVMQAIYGSGSLTFENRNWETQYVVDASSVEGLRGTFTTIQSAITQAIADGVATASNYANILIRNGTYTENLSFGNVRIHLMGLTPSPNVRIQQPQATIVGSITMTAGGVLFLENISLTNGGSASIVNTTGGVVHAYNSYIANATASTGQFFGYSCTITDTAMTGGSLELYDCDLQVSSAFTLANVSTCIMTRCNYVSAFTTSIVLTGTTSPVVSYCKGMSFSGTGAGTLAIQNSTIINAINLSSATINASEVSKDVNATTITELITQVPSTIYPAQSGNVLMRRSMTVNGNITNNDQYVGCNKAGALAVSLVRTNFIKGQFITIKDESGAAAANNITITPSAGTIDGAASFVLNTNYQAINVIFDGTNFFIF